MLVFFNYLIKIFIKKAYFINKIHAFIIFFTYKNQILNKNMFSKIKFNNLKIKNRGICVFFG